jgi:hypothetical protein
MTSYRDFIKEEIEDSYFDREEVAFEVAVGTGVVLFFFIVFTAVGFGMGIPMLALWVLLFLFCIFLLVGVCIFVGSLIFWFLTVRKD